MIIGALVVSSVYHTLRFLMIWLIYMFTAKPCLSIKTYVVTRSTTGVEPWLHSCIDTFASAYTPIWILHPARIFLA
jgi:hypothetical protein